MDSFRDIRADGLHHAYAIADTSGHVSALVEHLERELSMSFTGNPDVHVREYETLSIDECREVIRRAYVKPLGNRSVFVLAARSLTREAQNSLLKLFEEPPTATHFFLWVPTASQLLPTLRSRVWLIEEREDIAARTSTAQQFLHTPLAERIALVDAIAKERDVDRAGALLNELEAALYTGGGAGPEREALEHIIAVRRQIHSTGAPLKALLESVALVCP